MQCRDLKVVNLNITEDYYEYKALFRLCTDSVCMDVDLDQLSKNGILEDIKKSFSVQEPIDEIKNILMEKIMEATKLESRISEGESCCKDIKDEGIQRSIDSLSAS